MNNSFTLKQRILFNLAGLFGPLVLNLLGMTWKVSTAGQTGWDPNKQKQKCIYCFWHNRLLGLAYTQKNRNIGVLISSSFDGEIIARITARLGFLPLRGSSTKNGSAGLIAMIKNERVRHLAITVDGPRGPRGKVKPGVIFLAAKTGLPIVPVSCNSSRKWVLGSWDRFEIPKPFARVTVCLGEPVFISTPDETSQDDKSAGQLGRTLNELGNCS